MESDYNEREMVLVQRERVIRISAFFFVYTWANMHRPRAGRA